MQLVLAPFKIIEVGPAKIVFSIFDSKMTRGKNFKPLGLTLPRKNGYVDPKTTVIPRKKK